MEQYADNLYNIRHIEHATFNFNKFSEYQELEERILKRRKCLKIHQKKK
jgi:hypothetical protein